MADKSPARSVLVVDDEALIRWSLGETLLDQGLEVKQAASAAEALQVVNGAARPFDIIFLDFRLPDSNDLKLLEHLRRILPAGRIILMTAFGTPDMVQAALDLGAFRVLNKPFELGEIAALVSPPL
jgi:DNA-binding NtrC family response regulator